MEQTKTCRTCQQDKPLADFPLWGKDANGEQRYRPDCKVCFNAKRRAENGGGGVRAADALEAVAQMQANRAAERVLPDGRPFMPPPPYWNK